LYIRNHSGDNKGHSLLCTETKERKVKVTGRQHRKKKTFFYSWIFSSNLGHISTPMNKISLRTVYFLRVKSQDTAVQKGKLQD